MNTRPVAGVYESMNRVKKHQVPKGRMADRLRRAGYDVRSVPSTRGFDLLLNGHVRVAMRVAFPRMRKHHVTVRNRHYTYRYRSWHFNFHHHGKLDERYADVFLCVAMEPHHPSREQVFVIPWSAVSGKTFSLHAARKRYNGRYAPYVNRWGVIAEAVAEPPTRLQAVA
jgi:hypothetical protein